MKRRALARPKPEVAPVMSAVLVMPRLYAAGPAQACFGGLRGAGAPFFAGGLSSGLAAAGLRLRPVAPLPDDDWYVATQEPEGYWHPLVDRIEADRIEVTLEFVMHLDTLIGALAARPAS